MCGFSEGVVVVGDDVEVEMLGGCCYIAALWLPDDGGVDILRLGVAAQM